MLALVTEFPLLMWETQTESLVLGFCLLPSGLLGAVEGVSQQTGCLSVFLLPKLKKKKFKILVKSKSGKVKFSGLGHGGSQQRVTNHIGGCEGWKAIGPAATCIPGGL